MIYPKFLEENDTIGITAVSGGLDENWQNYYLKSLNNLKKLNYKIKETNNTRLSGLVSSSGEVRAKEFIELIKDDNVKMIMCARGGDFLVDMLEFVNFKIIKKYPKWIQGYSDPTSLLFYITTKLDIATIYGPNAGAYFYDTLHKSLKNNLDIIRGSIPTQTSFKLYQSKDSNEISNYVLDSPVKWIGSIDVRGRLIGGCIDSLKYLVGTKYDNVSKFVDKYKDDGIVWYFDIFALTSEGVSYALWQMKNAGWFKYSKAFIFGRIKYPNTHVDLTYYDAIKRVIEESKFIMEADIGHVRPSMTFINGSIIDLKAKNGKGKVDFTLR